MDNHDKKTQSDDSRWGKKVNFQKNTVVKWKRCIYDSLDLSTISQNCALFPLYNSVANAGDQKISLAYEFECGICDDMCIFVEITAAVHVLLFDAWENFLHREIFLFKAFTASDLQCGGKKIYLMQTHESEKCFRMFNF